MTTVRTEKNLKLSMQLERAVALATIKEVEIAVMENRTKKDEKKFVDTLFEEYQKEVGKEFKEMTDMELIYLSGRMCQIPFLENFFSIKYVNNQGVAVDISTDFQDGNFAGLAIHFDLESFAPEHEDMGYTYEEPTLEELYKSYVFFNTEADDMVRISSINEVTKAQVKQMAGRYE